MLRQSLWGPWDIVTLLFFWPRFGYESKHEQAFGSGNRLLRVCVHCRIGERDFDSRRLARNPTTCAGTGSGSSNPSVVGQCAAKRARKIRRLFRGRLLANSLEFSHGGGDLDFPAGLTDLRMAARFRWARLYGKPLAFPTGNPLRDSLFLHRRHAEFSFTPVWKFLPRTSLRLCDAEFSAVVSRAADWPGRCNSRRDDPIGCALRCFPSCTANMVDLGNGRGSSFRLRRSIHRARIHRAAI